MIRNIHAVAIDDEEEHLDAICEAAIKADIICRRLHHPKDKPEDISSELSKHPIQLVICDLYLQAVGALGGTESAYGTIGSILENLGLRPWSPYVMLLWFKRCPRYQTSRRTKSVFGGSNFTPIFAVRDYSVGQNKVRDHG